MEANEDRKAQNKLPDVKIGDFMKRGCMIWYLHRQKTGLHHSFSF